MKKNKPIHIAIDLDKTLAFHESSWGVSRVGEPIVPMVEKVKEWLTKGYKVTIFTSRVNEFDRSSKKEIDEQVKMIEEFLNRAGLPLLPITSIKRRYFTHYVDDRSYHVERNLGKISDEIDI